MLMALNLLIWVSIKKHWNVSIKLKLSPNRSEAWYNEGSTLLKLGRYQEALECYNKVLELDKNDYTTWYNKGNILKEFANTKKP